jgi:uncharacterized protein DUF3307
MTALIIAHLIGDFLLQNHWMQRKSESSWVCTVHVAVYALPMMFVAPGLLLALILIEHWLQDRFGLHLRWMRFYGQTPPDKWPVGPLCVDQAMHIAFMGLFYWLCS